MTHPGDRLTETLFLPNPDGSGHPGATTPAGFMDAMKQFIAKLDAVIEQ